MTGPKFVEIAGRLSLAAEDAIVNERQTIVETIQLKNDDAAKKEMNYIMRYLTSKLKLNT